MLMNIVSIESCSMSYAIASPIVSLMVGDLLDKILNLELHKAIRALRLWTFHNP